MVSFGGSPLPRRTPLVRTETVGELLEYLDATVPGFRDHLVAFNAHQRTLGKPTVGHSFEESDE